MIIATALEGISDEVHTSLCQAMNTDAEGKATEIRPRAESKAGQLSAEKERGKSTGTGSNQHQSRTVQRGPSSYETAERSANIRDTQARRRQKFVFVPAASPVGLVPVSCSAARPPPVAGCSSQVACKIRTAASLLGAGGVALPGSLRRGFAFGLLTYH